MPHEKKRNKQNRRRWDWKDKMMVMSYLHDQRCRSNGQRKVLMLQELPSLSTHGFLETHSWTPWRFMDSRSRTAAICKKWWQWNYKSWTEVNNKACYFAKQYLTAVDVMTGDRGSWNSWLEFLFSALGSLVGLGNIWRFPYVCYRSGGGAFLIPFLVALVVCGCPLLFLETLHCQFSNLGPGRVWVICPLFKGIGFSMMTMTFVVSVYYTMILAWTLHYLAMSFSQTLPWSSCRLENALVDCETGHNASLSNLEMINITAAAGPGDEAGYKRNFSSISLEEEYWFKEVLDISSSIEDMGRVRWQLLLCLLGAWVLVILCLSKGIKSLGKVAYVAVTLPYIILTSLLIRGCLLPGAREGLYYYMIPDWNKLAEFEVWRNAAGQVFFSVGLGFGIMSTLASYNKFHNNCYRDAMILPVLDCLTSLYAGLVVFSFLGHMAYRSGSSIDNVVSEGPGLVFIAYPAALSTLPFPQIWSVLFFLMLFCVGLDSQFLHIQTLSAAMVDCFPYQLSSKKTLVMISFCVVSFILGIPLTMQGGFYLLNLMDWYIASISLMLIVIIEILVLTWIYGVEQLYSDVEAMIGYRPNLVWKFAWKYITPLFVVVLWMSGIVKYKTISSTSPGYPAWTDGLGLSIAILPVLPILVKLVWTLLRREGTLLQRIRSSIQPSDLWKPAKLSVADVEMKALNDEMAG